MINLQKMISSQISALYSGCGVTVGSDYFSLITVNLSDLGGRNCRMGSVTVAPVPDPLHIYPRCVLVPRFRPFLSKDVYTNEMLRSALPL